MENLALFERQIDNAIFALDYLKVEVTIENVLYMLQYSHDNMQLDVQSWTTYCKVAENLRKRIAVYEESRTKSVKPIAPTTAQIYVDAEAVRHAFR